MKTIDLDYSLEQLKQFKSLVMFHEKRNPHGNLYNLILFSILSINRDECLKINLDQFSCHEQNALYVESAFLAAHGLVE